MTEKVSRKKTKHENAEVFLRKASVKSKQILLKTLKIVLDAVMLTTTFVFSWLLRFEFDLTDELVVLLLKQLPVVLMIQFAAILITGVYSRVWRYTGFSDAGVFLTGSGISGIPLLALRLFLPAEYRMFRIPYSISIITSILGFGGLLLLRLIRRAVHENLQKRRFTRRYESVSKQVFKGSHNSKKRIRVFLIGAGQAGLKAAKEIHGRADLKLDIAGFVDDDVSKHNLVISGVKVVGSTDMLPELVRSYNIDHVIITIAHATGTQISGIVKICERIPVKTRIIPGLFDLLDGKVRLIRIRDVQIEDLLGREIVELDAGIVQEYFCGKTILITGSGGSIGSELVRQVLRFNPVRVLMVERAEFALYQIHQEVCHSQSGKCVPLIADINDEERMNSIFKQYNPDVVLHSAAHKHVPLMEINSVEAIKNNALATWKLGEIAGKYKTGAFVLISTDKAVNPTSVMGASKRIAELFIQSLDKQFETRFLAVRFGNVLGSTGSVIPLFKSQINNGGPITVTHPEMTRYFMTITEAASLVLQASTMGQGGEIFILDMGEPVRIVDLAESMIRLSGLKPYDDVMIKYTGVRAGEKMFEELNTHDDLVTKTRHPKIFIGKIKGLSEESICDMRGMLERYAQNGCESELRCYLSKLIPEAKLSPEAHIV